MAFTLGRGAPRLAHRMLGHVDEGAGRAFRHSRRRTGPEISASRERNRADLRRDASAFAEIWMHNGFLNIDNEKMSKSLGNFFTAREVMTKIRHPEVLRFFLLSSQYRGPMNYSPDQLTQAEATLNGLYTALRDLPGASTAPCHGGDRRVRRRDGRRLQYARGSGRNAESGAQHRQRARSRRGCESRTGAAELRQLGEVLGSSARRTVPWRRRWRGHVEGGDRAKAGAAQGGQSRQRSLPPRIGFATNWRPPASSSKTSPAALPWRRK